jgi:hypothetical protein
LLDGLIQLTVSGKLRAEVEICRRIIGSELACSHDLLYGTVVGRYKNDPRFSAFCSKGGLPPPG